MSLGLGRIQPGAVVLLHLVSPREQFWGILDTLGSAGLTIQGINLSSFDDWLTQAALKKPQSLGLATMFVPMHRVEKMFLDARVGAVESYCERFEVRVGMSVQAYLGLPPESQAPDR